MYKTFVISLILLISVASCRTKVVEMDDSFVGKWRTDHNIHDGYNTIEITEDSKAHYIEHGPPTDYEIHKTARIEDDMLYIGLRFSLTIDQYPTAENDTSCSWTSSGTETCIVYDARMILDGRNYYQVVETF